MIISITESEVSKASVCSFELLEPHRGDDAHPE